MKILFTGGGSGGHFYPIIAVAEEINRLFKEYKLVDGELYYMADSPYNEKLLFENRITFIKSNSGKIRRYFSILNFFDIFKTFFGFFGTFRNVFRLYPDIVFAKGGHGSFPTLLSAKLLGIPVVIHESDSEPGRVNLWAGKFAKRIAVSYPQAAEFFPKEKVALTGNPIRREVRAALKYGGREFLSLQEEVPVILFLGGSQGSKTINEVLLEALPNLVEKYQIVHQTGKKNFREMKEISKLTLEGTTLSNRYKPLDYLNGLALSMAAGVSSLVISRAGSAIFEIALWGLPSIIIPLSPEVSHDQHKNAFAYLREGACSVIEENNLTSHILISEIDRLMGNEELRKKMSEAAKKFADPEAAHKIAKEIMELAIKHEQ